MTREIPFEPHRFIADPHHQTILGSFLSFSSEPKSETKIVTLPDGDKIASEVTTPKNWKKTNLTIVFIHGLCGSHRSSYLVRLANKLEPLGIRTVRFNMRNCGSGKWLSRQCYHSGRNEDVFEVLKTLKQESPESPMILVGFSLGGNITLKLAGELNSLAHPFLKAAIAICPPVDLYSSVQLIGQSENWVYERYFSKILRSDVYELHRRFDLPKVNLPRDMKIYEFDQLYVAPNYGFKDAVDYYNKCSSIHVVDDIDIPCRILLSQDDPIINHRSLDSSNLPSNVELYKTKRGGHMGYLARGTSESGFHWLDSLVIRWISELSK